MGYKLGKCSFPKETQDIPGRRVPVRQGGGRPLLLPCREASGPHCCLDTCFHDMSSSRGQTHLCVAVAEKGTCLLGPQKLCAAPAWCGGLSRSHGVEGEGAGRREPMSPGRGTQHHQSAEKGLLRPLGGAIFLHQTEGDGWHG